MIIIKTMKMVVIYSILNNNDDDDNCDNGNDNDQLIMTIRMKIGQRKFQPFKWRKETVMLHLLSRSSIAGREKECEKKPIFPPYCMTYIKKTASPKRATFDHQDPN